MFTHMRIAKPVTDIETSFLMYSQGLGLQKIAEFNDHDGFNGIMLGRKDLGCISNSLIANTIRSNRCIPQRIYSFFIIRMKKNGATLAKKWSMPVSESPGHSTLTGM